MTTIKVTGNGTPFNKKISFLIPDLAKMAGWFMVDAEEISGIESLNLKAARLAKEQVESKHAYFFVSDLHSLREYIDGFGAQEGRARFYEIIMRTGILMPRIHLDRTAIFEAIHPDLFRATVNGGSLIDSNFAFLYRVKLEEQDIQVNSLSLSDRYAVIHGYAGIEKDPEVAHLKFTYDFLNYTMTKGLSHSISLTAKKLSTQTSQHKTPFRSIQHYKS